MHQAEAANELCRTQIGACHLRDTIQGHLLTLGWCRVDKIWKQCQPAPARDGRPVHEGAGDWYLSIRENLLRVQLARCDDFTAARNEPLAKACRDELLNADEYLVARAKRSVIPQAAWLLCSQEIAHELALAARCITAIEDACPVSAAGQLQDLQRCSSMIQSGAYIANPASMRLKLDTPRR